MNELVIKVDEPMPCPECGQPLVVEMKGVVAVAQCCGAELEPDAQTLIDLLGTDEKTH